MRRFASYRAAIQRPIGAERPEHWRRWTIRDIACASVTDQSTGSFGTEGGAVLKTTL
jgi:hypothetical protein